MRKNIDMICIARLILDEDIDTMLEVMEKIPVVTCVNNIFEEKETYTDFVCLLNVDELSAYGDEQLKRHLKKKHVAVVHDDEQILMQAQSLGYITIYIGNDYVSKQITTDYCFYSLEDMLDYKKRLTKKENIIAAIFAVIAILLLYLIGEHIISYPYIYVTLLASLIFAISAIYFYRIRKIWEMVLLLLDAIF